MSTVADNNVQIRCKHCGWTKLKLSYRQVGQPSDATGAAGSAQAPRVVTLIMRCLKCDRFTPIAG